MKLLDIGPGVKGIVDDMVVTDEDQVGYSSPGRRLHVTGPSFLLTSISFFYSPHLTTSMRSSNIISLIKCTGGRIPNATRSLTMSTSAATSKLTCLTPSPKTRPGVELPSI